MIEKREIIKIKSTPLFPEKEGKSLSLSIFAL